MSKGNFRARKRQRRKILSFGKKGREDKIARQGAGERISKLGAGAPHKEKEAEASEKYPLYTWRAAAFSRIFFPGLLL